MINQSFYTWHQAQWQTLTQDISRLGHAILLHGRAGIGKQHFAQQLSKRLLCHQPVDNQPCHNCPSCQWFFEGVHPDFITLTLEESKTKTGKKSHIAVAQIRQLIERLSLTNHNSSGLRVVLLHPADSLNQASANALLKVLEEPPNNTLFLLVTSHLQALLPTVISRCQQVMLPPPDQATAIHWLNAQGVTDAENLLAYAGGSPLTAQALSEQGGLDARVVGALAQGGQIDVMATVSLLTKMQMHEALTILQKWLVDLVLNYHAKKTNYHKAQVKALQALAKSVNLSKLLDYERTLLSAKQTAQHPLNQELQLIRLLQAYQMLFR